MTGLKSWKTLLAGIVVAVGMIGPTIGIPDEYSNIIKSIGALFLGLTAKDSDVTGGSKINSGDSVDVKTGASFTPAKQ